MEGILRLTFPISDEPYFIFGSGYSMSIPNLEIFSFNFSSINLFGYLSVYIGVFTILAFTPISFSMVSTICSI